MFNPVLSSYYSFVLLLKSTLVILLYFIFSSLAYSFEYKQVLAEYNGAVIGSLNNCGVNLSTNPKYLRGAGSVSLQDPGEEFLGITAFGERGIISVTKSKDVYYSPDALNLAGGGDTKYLGHINSNIISLSLFEVANENIAIIHLNEGNDSSTVLKVRSNSLDIVSYKPSKFMGYADNKVFIQKFSGAIFSYPSIHDYLSNKNAQYIETTEKTIENIKSFNAGILTLADGSLYYSTIKKLISGSDVQFMYPNIQRKITQMITVAGDTTYIPIVSGDITFFIPQANDHIILALKDGSIIWNNKKVLSITSATEIENQLAYMLYKLDFPYNSLPYDIFVHLRLNGEIDSVENVKVNFLNYGQSKEYGNSFFLAENIEDQTMGLVMGFNGLPTTVKVEDKGWSGFQYKWRGRGNRTGTFDHTYDSSWIGENKMRIKATHSCSVVAAIEFNNILTPLQTNFTELELSAAINKFLNFNLEDTISSVFNKTKTINSTFDFNDIVLSDRTFGFGWDMLDHYFAACDYLDNKYLSKQDYYKYACPEPVTIGDVLIYDDWGRSTITTPQGLYEYQSELTPQFKFVNGELVWTK
jgi:hypothetical protein